MSYASLLNTTCDIEQVTLTSDGMGSHTEAWAVLHNDIPTRVFDMTADERESMYQRESVLVTHKFYIEAQANMSEAKRVVHDATNYNIHSVREMGGRPGLMVLVTELVK